MSEGLPLRVDAVRLAARGAQLRNATPLGAMTRLAVLLTDTTGRVESTLDFSQESGRVRIDGIAAATLSLTCQRCLEPLAITVEPRFALALVADDDEAARLPDGLEPSIGGDGAVSPLALVEDELLLALPAVPLHEAGHCSAPVDAPKDAGGRDNPFAVLKRLKSTRK